MIERLQQQPSEEDMAFFQMPEQPLFNMMPSFLPPMENQMLPSFDMFGGMGGMGDYNMDSFFPLVQMFVGLLFSFFRL